MLTKFTFVIYILFLIIIFIAARAEMKGGLNVSVYADNKRYWALCLLMSLFMGLRYRVGGDTLWYHNNFDDFMPTLSELEGFDFKSAYFYPGWYYFNAVAKSIYDDFFVVQIIESLFVNFVFFYAFRKYSYYKYVCVAIYYFFFFLYFNTEIMREAISVSFFVISFDAILKKKWIIYYLVVIIGFAFHPSAVFLFLLPLLYKIIPSASIRNIAIVALVCFVFIALVNITSFIKFLPTEFLQYKAEYYAAHEALSIRSIIISLCRRTIPVFIMLVIYHKCAPQSGNKTFVERLNFLYLIISILSLAMDGFYRLLNYLMVPYVVLVTSNIVLFIKCQRNFKFGILVALALITGYQTYYYFFMDLNSIGASQFKYYQLWHPYSSVIDKQKDTEREKMYFKSMGHDW